MNNMNTMNTMNTIIISMNTIVISMVTTSIVRLIVAFWFMMSKCSLRFEFAMFNGYISMVLLALLFRYVYLLVLHIIINDFIYNEYSLIFAGILEIISSYMSLRFINTVV
jgi:hypothetical protein